MVLICLCRGLLDSILVEFFLKSSRFEISHLIKKKGRYHSSGREEGKYDKELFWPADGRRILGDSQRPGESSKS